MAMREYYPLLYTLFKQFKMLNSSELKKLNSWNKTILYNHAKVKVGSIKTIIE